MTSDGTKESYYETSHEVDVWRTDVDGKGKETFEHLGIYAWSTPQGSWKWEKSPYVETLTIADHRAVEAAEPTGSPVVPLDVKA